MKKIIVLSLSLSLIIVLAACSQSNASLPDQSESEKCLEVQETEQSDNLYQVSTLDALLAGVYDGDVPFSQLAKRGDFGLGTLNDLDGEMLALDGKFYQVKYDGSVIEVSPKQKTPFAQVNFFDTDKTSSLKDEISFEDLQKYIDGLLTTDNIFYAIKITGKFKYVKTRSVPKQEKPYEKLAEVVKDQSTFEFNNVEGTLIAYRSPIFVQGVGVPGYHFHFLTQDKQGGGHVLDLVTEDIKIEIDNIPGFEVDLLDNKDFYTLDFSEDKSDEAEKVEKE